MTFEDFREGDQVARLPQAGAGPTFGVVAGWATDPFTGDRLLRVRWNQSPTTTLHNPEEVMHCD
ncbi:hypothetical protein ACN20G_33645 (plasmid) [Streptomyces sp. BI20]|uniref:hypothetical protein n=1 Tax=Streptomyces sp. BI20 TaxID=3403460 RepID=UPI003C75BDD1